MTITIFALKVIFLVGTVITTSEGYHDTYGQCQATGIGAKQLIEELYGGTAVYACYPVLVEDDDE